MKPVILCYEKCTTCKKALKWVEEMGYDVEIRPIKEKNPISVNKDKVVLKLIRKDSFRGQCNFGIHVCICTCVYM